MKERLIIQGRRITAEDIQLIQQLMACNPSWLRTRLSKELCILWNWRNPKGELADMACLALLKKLEERGYLALPPSRQWGRKGNEKRAVDYVPHSQALISGKLGCVSPLRIEPVETKEHLALFKCLLAQYHYLGWSGTVGENMKYLVWDRSNRPLACLLFGAAAWACAPRDQFIGWNAEARKANLHLIANNRRPISYHGASSSRTCSPSMAKRCAQKWDPRARAFCCLPEERLCCCLCRPNRTLEPRSR